MTKEEVQKECIDLFDASVDLNGLADALSMLMADYISNGDVKQAGKLSSSYGVLARQALHIAQRLDDISL